MDGGLTESVEHRKDSRASSVGEEDDDEDEDEFWTLSKKASPLEHYFSSPVAEWLCVAARAGHYSMVLKLLRTGEHGHQLQDGDLEAVSHRRTDLHGQSALHYAASRPDGGRMILAMLNDARLRDPDVRSDAGQTPLQLAARSGDATSVGALLNSALS